MDVLFVLFLIAAYLAMGIALAVSLVPKDKNISHYDADPSIIPRIGWILFWPVGVMQRLLRKMLKRVFRLLEVGELAKPKKDDDSIVDPGIRNPFVRR